jgi:hypothetical protein
MEEGGDERTPQIDVEHVAVLLGGEFCAGLAGYEVSEGGVFAPELAVLVGVFVDFGTVLGVVS